MGERLRLTRDPERSIGSGADMVAGGSRYATAAAAVAEELAHTAIPSTLGPTWEGDDVLGETLTTRRVVRMAAGPFVYGGSAGIGWFLGHLAAGARSERAARLAVGAIDSALREAQAVVDVSPALLTGATGVAWVACDVGTRLRRRSLVREGLSLARRIARGLDEGSDIISADDLIAGLSGIIVGLLAIWRRAGDRALMNACLAASARLVSRSGRDGFGTWWSSEPEVEGSPALCGLGHGASGPAWALSEMIASAGRTEFQPIVDEALRYERGWFSFQHCAWADLRTSPDSGIDANGPAWMNAWCHGAFGIGAVRLRIYEATGDLAALAEATAAIEAARRLVTRASAAVRDGVASDVTLCHGIGGATELMLLAYEITGEREHLRAARRAGDVCLAIHATNGNRWTVGVPAGEFVPGLFTGLAGVGVTMARLHDPRAIPSPILPGRGRWNGRAHRLQRSASGSTLRTPGIS